MPRTSTSISPLPTIHGAPRPYVVINMALSADAKIASADHQLHTFGSERDLNHLHELRSEVDAILCGARTVNVTGATLGAGGPKWQERRRRNGLSPEPLRIVVTASGSIAPDAPLWSQGTTPVIVATTKDLPPDRHRLFEERGAFIWTSPGPRVDFKALIVWLHESRGIRHLLCEGGAQINDSLIREGLVDKIHVTLCPRIIGGGSSPTLADGPGHPALANAAKFALIDVTQHENELFLTYHAFC
jgi:riboflavin-specific deaminase-like protein